MPVAHLPAALGDRVTIGGVPATFAIEPTGSFSLAQAREFAGGFAAGIGAHATRDGILMTFPVEGWRDSAAVDIWQGEDGTVHGEVHGSDDLSAVRRQAARSLSLDHDGSGWAEVGRRDPVLGRIQARYEGFRPVCFYSAYEAATSFVIGQRIAMRQARVVKERLSEGWGDLVEIEGRIVRPFPRPQRLLEVPTVTGLSQVKVSRLHDLAQAALDGALDTDRLRSMDAVEALAELQRLPGVGPWTAQGILMRGCGVADAIPLADEISRRAVAAIYDLPELPDDATWTRISDLWRPYRMWATVLLHMAWRREQPTAPSYRQDA
ncbi:MAG: DNA-3-methyladenine glycosylase [Chloroflexota bacterium]|nr:DNA-3-methyladenine glycosylase [Chloroflexota bacterium]